MAAVDLELSLDSGVGPVIVEQRKATLAGGSQGTPQSPLGNKAHPRRFIEGRGRGGL